MRILIFIFSTLFTIQTYGQEDIKKITDNFLNDNNNFHNLNQEKFFLQTNKSTYFSGEKIWFKAYVVHDITNTPFYRTSNLHVSFYNFDRKIISNQLLFVENGVTHGEIELPHDAVSGNYYISLDTQWNKNFNTKNITPIQVINLTNNDSFFTKSNQNKLNSNNLNIQFYPESNTLLERAENTVIFTTKKGNMPISIEGLIIEEETKREITKFKSNVNGIGTFKLLYYPNKKYKAYVKLNGIQKQFDLPIVNKNGFIIHKKEKQEDNDEISFRLTTNKATVNAKINKVYFAVVHRKGYVRNVIPIKIDNGYNNYSFNLKKNNLFHGVNTITLFNQQNQVVTERKFYCNKDKIIHLEISEVNKGSDTIILNFKMLNKFIKANVSLSVLPLETKVYANNSNILTDFLIKPYINEKNQGLTNFFDNDLSSKEIDIFLQTYTNNNSFTNTSINKHSPEYDIENGVTINGVVNSDLKDLNSCKVMLSSKENNLLLVSNIKEKNIFEFDSLFLKHPTSYKLALVDNSGKVLKASFTVNKDFIKYKPDSILVINDDFYNYIYTKQFEASANFQSKPKDIEELNEVVVTSNKEKYNYEDILPDPKILGSSFSKKHKINETFYEDGSSVANLFNNIPGIQASLLDGFNGLKLKSSRGPKSITGDNYIMTVLVNGIQVSDLSLFKDMRADEIEDISVNASGAGYGLTGSNGVILIKTKKNASILKKINHLFSETEFGFSVSTEKYENFPLNFPDEISKKFFSTIDWIPDFIINPNASNYLKINKSGYENIKLIINGFNENGDLIFKEINIH